MAEKILDDVVRAYHAACARHGRPKQLGEDMIWGAGIYLADTQQEAMRRLEPSHDERYKWFAPFGFVRYADEEGRTWGTPGASARVPSLADGVQQKAWFCGPPSQVIEGIKSIEAKYPGLEDFMIHWAEGLPPDEFKEQLRWFARDVMPAFNRSYRDPHPPSPSGRVPLSRNAGEGAERSEAGEGKPQRASRR